MTLSRRNVIIGAIAGTWVILLLLTFLLVRSSQQSGGKAVSQITPSAAVKRAATDIEKTNLLYNKSEQEKAERDYNAKIGKTATVVGKKSAFTFELIPSLKKTVSPTPEGLKRVLGVATTCNIDSAPQSIYVYDLKTHWIVEEAANLALEYAVDSPAYSLPTDSGSYQYQFTSKDNKAFFSLYEASGIYKYHLASITNGAELDQGAMRDRANAFITLHKLNNKIAPPVANPPSGATTTFVYKRLLDDFKLTDSSGVQGAATSSLCNLPDSTEVGDISVQVRKDGSVANLVNGTRTIMGSYKANRLSLEAAIAEFATAQPVDPIVIPPTSTVDTGKVVIDSAVLAYYDVGSNFGQTLYTPTYITHGTVGGVQVIAFFPAVSATELLKKGLVKTVPIVGNSASQQQGILAFATPTPYMPPAPPAAGPISGPGCPGNAIDYDVTCSVNGTSICRVDQFEGKIADDPLKVCTSACQSATAVVTAVAGTSPCKTYMDQYKVTPVDGSSVGIENRSSVTGGTQVSCVLNGCPC
ncbi:hypothetical protein HYS00_04685 [Candidatus Microgenomates bacterium]|nr:hypothetical protein [Candidatus Microgenomates bacterium]